MIRAGDLLCFGHEHLRRDADFPALRDKRNRRDG
jgi:hypothetical protein